ncbi:hypothetical protein [Stenotrophomonas rhizophila]
MSLSGEQILVRCLKIALLFGTGYFLFALGRLMITMECTSSGYPGSFLWSWLLSLVALVVYSRFDILSKGLFKARVSRVRVAAACLLSTEVVIAAHLGAELSACQSGGGSRIVPPAAFLLVYTSIALSLLFGDAWLGMLRTVIRLGKRPFDLSAADDEDPVGATRTASRHRKRYRS